MTTLTAPDAPPQARIWGLFSPNGLLMAFALTLAFGVLFFRWFLQQGEMSAKHIEDWGHAYFIPVISGYVVWKRREEIAATPLRTFWPGLIPLFLGLFCYLFFLVGVPNHMLSGGAMLLTLFGVVLTICGAAMMRLLFLPLAYLAFGVTISDAIMNDVTLQLQLISSKGAYVILSLIGALANFTVDQQGNVLTITDGAGVAHKMNVAEACSGIRMVVAFIALAGAVAMLGATEWWKRLALLALSVPVSVIMNIVRVTVLGILTLFDANLATGEAHTLIGTILLVPALLLFMFVNWVLNKIVKPQAGVAA